MWMGAALGRLVSLVETAITRTRGRSPSRRDRPDSGVLKVSFSETDNVWNVVTEEGTGT